MTHTLTREECETFVWDKLREYLTKVHNGEIKTSEEALDRLQNVEMNKDSQR